MEKIKRFIKEFGISILSLAIPLSAGAFAPTGGTGSGGTVGAQPQLPTGTNVPYASGFVSTQSVLNFGCTVFSWMFYGLIVLAVVFVVVGAYKYLTSSGEAEKVKSANNTLMYAAIAVAVALLAKAIPSIVASFLGAGSSSGGGFGGGGFLAC
ncbi:MAG TPA: hypothetical protein VMT81_01025 [Candidatus Paceibacterota bacterium]|nr:hypothetical protein [Candidatus Paceibacterota bacterium]